MPRNNLFLCPMCFHFAYLPHGILADSQTRPHEAGYITSRLYCTSISYTYDEMVISRNGKSRLTMVKWQSFSYWLHINICTKWQATEYIRYFLRINMTDLIIFAVNFQVLNVDTWNYAISTKILTIFVSIAVLHILFRYIYVTLAQLIMHTNSSEKKL